MTNTKKNEIIDSIMNLLIQLTSPKTKKSIRTIGMSETVASVFKAQKEYTDELKIALGENYAHPEMVFPSANEYVALK